MAWLYGVAGCLGFEALKWYRRIWAGRPPLNKKNRVAYVLTLLIVTIFSGVVASLVASDDALKALLVGYGIPSGMSWVKPPSNHRADDTVDDIEVTKDNASRNLAFCLNDFFDIPE